MVRLTGPTLGGQASGSLADALTFSKSKGRNYVKFKASPKQPNTNPQIAIKAALAGLSNAWTTLAAAAQQTWQSEATRLEISPFNAYLKWNLHRFRSKLPPASEFPSGTDVAAALWNAPTPTKTYNTIRLDWNVMFAYNLWLIVIAKRSGPGDLWSWFNLVALVNQEGPGTGHAVNRNPITGLNEYRFYLASYEKHFTTIQHKVQVTWP